MKPRLFIGSSIEALPIARAIQENLEFDADIRVWTEDVFELSSSTIDDLISASETSDFGVFIFNPDDVIQIRNEHKKAVRDNVIFELGLFIGKLGRDKVFYVIPRDTPDLRLPTDLIGVAPGFYNSKIDKDKIKSALAVFSNQVRIKLESFYYDTLIGFENESKTAKRLAIEKPENWKYSLAYEILKPRFTKLKQEMYDFENGLIFKKNKSFEFLEGYEFLKTFLLDYVSLNQIGITLLSNELKKCFSEENTNPNKIKNWCEKIALLSSQYLELEENLLNLNVDYRLKSVIDEFKNYGSRFVFTLNKFETIFQKLGNGEKLKPDEQLKFDLPNNIDNIKELMTQAIKSWHQDNHL